MDWHTILNRLLEEGDGRMDAPDIGARRSPGCANGIGAAPLIVRAHRLEKEFAAPEIRAS
jgi:hypothetical protein